MLKKFRTFMIGCLIALLALIVFVVQAEEVAAPKWLDPQNCHFSKPLTETEGLMDNLGWESHIIKNGIVSVAIYKPEWKEKYKAASAEMQKRWQTMDPAKPRPMTGAAAR